MRASRSLQCWLSASAARADITIGLVAPLTGPVAAYGDQVKNGAQAAVDEINKKGGILGEKVVLKLADDAGEPKQGVSAANQLVGEGVQFRRRPGDIGRRDPGFGRVRRKRHTDGDSDGDRAGPDKRGLTNVLRTCGRDDQQAEVAADYVLKNFKDKRDRHHRRQGHLWQGPRRCLQGGAQRRRRHGSQQQLADARRKGFRALITRIKAEKVDVIYFGGYHPEGGLLARQLQDVAVNATIIGGEGLSNTEFWAIGNDAAAGTLFTNASDAMKNPDFGRCRQGARRRKNIPAEAFTLNAYAAVEVLKAGIEKAGSADDAEAVGDRAEVAANRSRPRSAT